MTCEHCNQPLSIRTICAVCGKDVKPDMGQAYVIMLEMILIGYFMCYILNFSKIL